MGEKRTREIIGGVKGHPVAIKTELKRLVDAGKIVKVRRSVYDLPARALPTPKSRPMEVVQIPTDSEPVHNDRLLDFFKNPRSQYFWRRSIEKGRACRKLIKRRVKAQYSQEEAETLNYYLSADTNGECNDILYQTPVTDEEKHLMAEQCGYIRAAYLTEDPTHPDIFSSFCGIPLSDFLNQLP